MEIWVVRPFQCGRGPVRASLKQRRIDYLKTILQSTFLFLLGVAICFLITEVGKRKIEEKNNKFFRKFRFLIGTIGRLRPYYITACNPIWMNIRCTERVTTANGQLDIPQ